MGRQGHRIQSVAAGSIAEQLDIRQGDILLTINDRSIEDIFDYHFLIHDEQITMVILKPDGEEWELEIEKEYDDDIGIDFEQGLMDEYRSCQNKCMFCFIDQMPEGMRETLYFKDDDARLSFLQGNYITLTNIKDKDLKRIILYKLSPINISVHTTNKELRCQMLHNRFAGEIMDKIQWLYDGKIEMNSQIVLCKGYNDKEELDRTIQDLAGFYPYMRSLSVVPVGLTKYRNGLTPLEKFEKKDADLVLKQIHDWQKHFLKSIGTRFVYASDEWYLTAGIQIPEEESYEGYGQIENGVGMVRSLIEEVKNYLETLDGDSRSHVLSIATGKLAAPILSQLIGCINEKFPAVTAKVYPIVNHFFGTDITVAGLLTGQDIIEQLKGEILGDFLLIPDVMLKSKEKVFLDNITVDEMEKALQTGICIVQSDGKSFVDNVIGNNRGEVK